MAGFNIGSLASGFAQGLGIGNNINTLIDQDQIAKIRAQGIAEARAAQASGTPQVVDGQQLSASPQSSGIPGAVAAPVNTDLAQFGQPQMSADGVSTMPVATPMTSDTSRLSSMPLASADPNMPAAQGVTIKGDKRYRVGNTSFDSIEEANKHAASQAPDMDTLMRQKLAPRMREAYLAQGDMAKADAWSQWAEEGEGRVKMKNWSTAFMAAQAGDYDGAAKSLQKLHGEFADGRTIESTEAVKDNSGRTTGFNINYRDDNTGEVRSQFMDRDTMVEQGLSTLSPQAMFEQAWKSKSSADGLRAKAAIDNQNDQRTAVRDQVKLDATATREDKRLASQQAHDFEIERMRAERDANKERSTPRGQILQTDEGPMLVDPKTGQAQPVRGANGEALQPKLKPVPAPVMKALTENTAALTKVDRALSAVEKYPAGLGVKNYLGDSIRQRSDPDGIDVRALVADIGSLKVHDRSGAAVTASETPRLMPFIPSATDDPVTVRKKLMQFREEYGSLVDDIQSTYSREQGYAVPGSKVANAKDESKSPSASKSAPSRNTKGWTLHTDAAGNRAYVSPDGKSFEEVK